MALYTKESIERLKESVDLYDLIRRRVDLRRAGGARYVGLCPFHDEDTPSFSVSADRGFWHCFGCGESGDAITFVRKLENLDFAGALEHLSETYGVELEREDEDPAAAARRRARERLIALLGQATAFYERYLWDSDEAAPAREYLAARGLSEEALRRFRVGYAPRSGDQLVHKARGQGFSEQELFRAGLARRRGGRPSDYFFERILFPVADRRGRVLGFGGRILREDQHPKYVNTAESDLFSKRRNLFGIDHARAPAAAAGRMVVVEGYTDVVSLSQAGLGEVVAIMGTGFTTEQFGELSRLVGDDGTIYLALDADRAGQEAISKTARAAGDRRVELRVVAMPEGVDPAGLVADAGPDAFLELLSGALSVPEFEVRRALARADLSTPHGRDRALAEIRPLIGRVPPRTATRDALIAFAADALDLPPSYLAPEEAPAPRARPSEPSPPRARASIDPAARIEREFLVMCVALPTTGRAALQQISDEHLSDPRLRRVRDWLRDHIEDPHAGLPDDDPEFSALVNAIVDSAAERPTEPVDVHVQVKQLEKLAVERALDAAVKAGDASAQSELLRRREELRVETDRIIGQEL